MAFNPPFRRYTRWDRTSASDQNAVRERVELLERASGGLSRQLGGVPLPLPQTEDLYWIEIDAEPSDPTLGYPDWHQVCFADDGSTFQPEGALQGSTDALAWEVNDTAVAAGQVCLARLSDEDGSLIFLGPASGVATTAEGVWRYSTSTTIADPGSGKFRLNTGAGSTSTHVAFSATTDGGTDF